MDRRCFILADNALVGASFSGGNWALTPSNLAIGNMLQDVARCSTGEAADAVFTVSWGRPITVGALALAGYTGPAGGRVRLTFRRGGGVVMATGWEYLWPRIAKTADLTPDHPGWLTGRPSAAERAAYPHMWMWLPSSRLRADAVTVEIDARGGAFDISYGYVAPIFRPDWPIGWGRELTQEDKTALSVTLGGMIIEGPRLPVQRGQAATFHELSKVEAMRWLDISRQRRRAEPVLFMPDPGDAANWMREAFVGVFDGLLGFKEINVDSYEVTVKIKEMIA